MRNIFFTLIIIATLSSLRTFAQSEPRPASSPSPRVALGVINGKATNLPVPEYPEAAKAIRASGMVRVSVSIDEAGNVYSAKVVSGHPLLQQAAEKAALQSKFTPTKLKGEPVKVTGIIEYKFVLENQPEEQVPVWGFGLFLTFLQNTDADFLKAVGDDKELDDILLQMAREVPAKYASEKALFDKLASTRDAERRKAAAELIQALKKHLNAAELWELEFGGNLGRVLIETIRHTENIAHKNFANEPALRDQLQKLKDNLKNAPPEIAPEILLQFRQIAGFADSPDLNSIETLTKLYQALAPLFGTNPDN